MTNTPRNPADAVDPEAPSSSSPAWREYAVEAAVGLAIAALMLWVAVASATDIPFVYQGL